MSEKTPFYKNINVYLRKRIFMKLLHKNIWVKVIILSVTAICFGIGFFMLNHINLERKRWSTSIFDFVPPQSDVLIYGKSLHCCDSFISLPKAYKDLFDKLPEEQSSLLIPQNDDFLILQKNHSMLDDKLRHLLENRIFTAGLSRSKTIDGIRYLFFQNREGCFFCCTFINGIFIGSYNFQVVVASVKAFTGKNNLQFSPEVYNNLEKMVLQKSPVVISRNGTNIYAFNLWKDIGVVNIKGVDFQNINIKSKNSFNNRLLTDSLTSVSYADHIYLPFNSSIRAMLKGNSYQLGFLHRNELKQVQLYPLQTNLSVIDTLMNNQKVSLGNGLPFASHAGKYHLYKADLLMEKDTLKDALSPIYWTQWKDNIILSSDIVGLVRYIRIKDNNSDCYIRENVFLSHIQNNPVRFDYSRNINLADIPLFNETLLKLLNMNPGEGLISYHNDHGFCTFDGCFKFQ